MAADAISSRDHDTALGSWILGESRRSRQRGHDDRSADTRGNRSGPNRNRPQWHFAAPSASIVKRFGQYCGQLAAFGLSSNSWLHFDLLSQSEQHRCMSRSTAGSIARKVDARLFQPAIKQATPNCRTVWRVPARLRRSGRHPAPCARVQHCPGPAIPQRPRAARDSGSKLRRSSERNPNSAVRLMSHGLPPDARRHMSQPSSLASLAFNQPRPRLSSGAA